MRSSGLVESLRIYLECLQSWPKRLRHCYISIKPESNLLPSPSGQCWVSGVLSIMPNRPVRDQWEYLTKMERHFPIKPGQPIGMALAAFCYFSELPNWGREPVCQWNGEFRSEYSNRKEWTTSRGDLEYSGRKKPKQTFPFEFRPKFQESLA